MNTKLTLLIIVIIAILIAFGFFTVRKEPAAVQDAPVSNEIDMAIRSRVIEFGTKMRNVSLLAPNAKDLIATEYGSYLTMDLLTTWQADPSKALGRNTSSPWPESIDVVSIVEGKEGAYTVEANVIEITTENPREVAVVYPVTFVVEPSASGDWVIASTTKGAYSELPQRISVVGFWECLPHRDKTGPQTEECAIGLAIDQSDGHYAINTQLMSQMPVDFSTGTKVRIEGVLTPIEQLSSNSWQKYDIDGILSATSITQIK